MKENYNAPTVEIERFEVAELLTLSLASVDIGGASGAWKDSWNDKLQ